MSDTPQPSEPKEAPKAEASASPAESTSAPAVEAAPAAPVASSEKKGMSTGLKVFLWIFAACAVLAVVGIIITAWLTKEAADEFNDAFEAELEALEAEYDYDY